jgi:hypothetical protein
VDERLADSGKLISVPGVIMGIADKDAITKQAPCEFKTFNDFVFDLKEKQAST